MEEYDEAFHTTTSSSAVYSTLDFPYEQLKANAMNYAADPNNQNPLSGYSYINPNELVIGAVNRHNDFDIEVHTNNNVDYLDNITQDNFDDLPKTANDLTWHDDDDTWNTVCTNSIGVDADGDGTDELVLFSLQQKENDSNDMQKGTYIRVQLYDRVKISDGENLEDISDDVYEWQKIDEYHTVMQGDSYLYGKLSAYENPSLMPLAAGDYDDDGKEELAYYMADKRNSDDSLDARVVIENFDKNGNNWSHSEVTHYYLKDINEDYGHIEYDLALPVVALSTTSTRLGEIENPDPNTRSAKRYHTYDDLVVSVSVPRPTCFPDLTNKSTTVIIGKKDDQFVNLFQHEYSPVSFDNPNKELGDTLTAYGVNTCDADLNGDGFKEIFAAAYGRCAHNNEYVSDTEIDVRHSLANIITYNYESQTYEMVWNVDKVIDQSNQKYDFATWDDCVKPPISLCAGRFMPVKLDLKEQVFINGFVYDLEGTKLTGRPEYYCYDANGHQTNYIPDTLPGYDKQNFPEDNVTFSKKYYYDLDPLMTEHFAGYGTAVSGRYLPSELDQIAVISYQPKPEGSGNSLDRSYYADISILSYSSSVEKWEYKYHNNYINGRDSKHGGTSMFICFVDSEPDTAVYRWMGSYCSYSAPTLYAICLAPPYYREANGVYAYDYHYCVGNTEDSTVDWHLGGAVEVAGGVTGDVSLLGVKFKFDVQGVHGLEGGYVGNKSWGNEREIAKGVDLNQEENCAVCYVTPWIINVYEVYQARPTAAALAASDAARADENGSQDVIIDHTVKWYTTKEEPIFVSTTIDKYNEAVRQQQKDGDGDEEWALKLIDVSKLPLSTNGDPVTYPFTLKEASGKDSIADKSTTEGEVDVAVVNSTSEKVEGELTFAKSDSIEHGGELSISVGFRIGLELQHAKLDVDAALVGGAGYAKEKGTTNGVSFGISYDPPNAEHQLLGSVEFNKQPTPQGTPTEKYNFGGSIVHYDVETGTWYDYDAHSVAYLSNYTGGGEMGVYAHVFYVNFENVSEVNIDDDDTPADLHYPFPPEPPINFSIQSVKKNSDGSLDVKLIWDVVNRNKLRKADGYNIYMSDSNENQGKQLHLQNKEGLIVANQSSHYMTYTIHLGAGDYSDENLNFYIAPAYYQKLGKDSRALEGTLSHVASIVDVEDVNSKLIITKQPHTYWLSNNGDNETATFSVEMEKSAAFNPTDDTVHFQWKMRRLSSDEWTDLPEQTKYLPDADGKFRSTCSIEVPGNEKALYEDTLVYCEIACSNTIQNSDLVFIDIDRTNAVKVSSWQELQQQIYDVDDGSGIMLTGDVTALKNDSALVVPTGKTITLNLNSFTLDRALSNKAAVSDGAVIINGGNLTITGDGTITGGNHLGAGGAIQNHGVLTIDGCTIIGNYSSMSGGAICNIDSTLTIEVATITGNTAEDHGGGIYNTSALTIVDGMIKNNTSVHGDGGGVYCTGTGNFNIYGRPIIINNTANGKTGDVYCTGNTLTVTDNLAFAASIGVQYCSGFQDTITSGLNGKGGAFNFVSNDSEYSIALNSAGEAILQKRYMIGDANLDGMINIDDVTTIQRHLGETEFLENNALLTADTTCNGNITIEDATLLQCYLAEFKFTANTRIGQYY